MFCRISSNGTTAWNEIDLIGQRMAAEPDKGAAGIATMVIIFLKCRPSSTDKEYQKKRN